MLKKIVFISLFGVSAFADITSFYQAALKNLEYNKNYTLYEKANKISQSAITYSKYANFSADAAYSKTYAKLLPSASGSFGTTDISLHDNMDLFGKNDYKIQALRLDSKIKRSNLNLKKEQLFIALANIISLYNQTALQLKIRQELYSKQYKIYEKLETLEKNGDVTELNLLRFKNTLTTLQTNIVSMKQELSKMKTQLKLYVPDQSIPKLTQTKMLYTKKDFLLHNPQAKINELDAQKLLSQSKGMKNSYIPTINVSAAYQKLDDPTSYGNNHSFGVALHLPLNGGDFKEAEALKVAALSKETKSTEYKIQREQEYIRHYQTYKNAKKQLEVLEQSQKDFEKSEVTIQKAYLKQYVDFSTYLQVLQQALNVKNHIIALKNKIQLEATIINTIASGKVYE
jgi:outer membrane protein TolC